MLYISAYVVIGILLHFPQHPFDLEWCSVVFPYHVTPGYSSRSDWHVGWVWIPRMAFVYYPISKGKSRRSGKDLVISCAACLTYNDSMKTELPLAIVGMHLL